MSATEPTFPMEVEGFVRDALRESVPGSFDELVVRLPGVYPAEARSALDHLVQRGELSAATLSRLRRRDAGRWDVGAVPGPLPVPHPLDYDWRFSQSAVDRLLTECQARLSETRAVLLGTPTLFCALRQRDDLPTLLLDANPAVIDALPRSGADLHEARLCDLSCDELPAERSALLVVDPPWYRDHERLFLWAAARLCRCGGSVLGSMPAEGTRPGVMAERAELLEWADRLGFVVEGIEPGALGYVSPPFERSALEAVGLRGIPAEWRHGDLVVLRLEKHAEIARPPCTTDARWPEVAIGAVRIRVRAASDAAGGDVLDPRLREIVPGDVLDTVSRRDPRRRQVSVWTSGNRVFGTRSPGALIEVIRSLVDCGDPEGNVRALASRPLSAIESRNIGSALAQVRTVVDTERAELATMGWAA